MSTICSLDILICSTDSPRALLASHSGHTRDRSGDVLHIEKSSDGTAIHRSPRCTLRPFRAFAPEVFLASIDESTKTSAVGYLRGQQALDASKPCSWYPITCRISNS